MVPTKVLLGVGGVSVAGAGSVGGYLYFSSQTNKETFRSKYEKALIKNFEDSIWSKKLAALGSGSPVHKDLIQAKNKNDLPFLKDACKGIYDSPFSEDLINDFKTFCSRNYSDQIVGRTVISSEADLNNKWNDFKGKTDSDLGGELLKIQKFKKDSETEPDGWKKLVLDACLEMSSSIFEGEIKGYQEFCTKA